jgi:endonuclease V-like protein UPF0215 family
MQVQFLPGAPNLMKTVRVQFDVPEKRIEDIEKLQELTCTTTRKDIYENGMTLLEWAVEQVQKGRLIGSRDDSGGFHEVTMPALNYVAKKVPV